MQLKAILYTTSTKNSYAMHTVKLLLTYYLSEQAANIYQIAESNRIEKINSVARIESNRNFFLPELECSMGNAFSCVCQRVCLSHGLQKKMA